MRLSIYFLLICLFTFTACDADNSSSASADGVIAQRLDNAAFSQKLKSTTDALLIDVRTPQEFQAGNIEGAINYDYRGSDFSEKLRQLDKDKPTFIYCQSGGRSGKTLAKMKKMGFKEVYELKTGYGGWAK